MDSHRRLMASKRYSHRACAIRHCLHSVLAKLGETISRVQGKAPDCRHRSPQIGLAVLKAHVLHGTEVQLPS